MPAAVVDEAPAVNDLQAKTNGIASPSKPLVNGTQSEARTTQLNGSLQSSTDQLNCIDDLIKERATLIPDTPLITYPSSLTRCADWVYYTARDLDIYTDEASKELTRLGLTPKERKSSKSEVVAVLGPSDLDYFITVLALSRMGFAVLYLSTRLHIEAYASLLEKTDCVRLVTTPRYDETVQGIRGTGRELQTWNIVEKSIYAREPTTPRFQKLVEVEDQENALAFIVHSSGSTGLPKPIRMSHRACLDNYAVGSGMRAFVTLPLFHNSGISNTFRGIVANQCTAIFNAAIPLTSANLVEGLEAIKPDSFNSVPYVLKILSETEEGLRALARCKVVQFAGSACPDELGDLLVDNDVNLIAHYGQTEMGQLMMSTRPPGDKTWNYVRPLPKTKPYIYMDPLGDGQYECVVLDGLPTKVLSNSDTPAPNSYRTRDTFELHPTIPDAWKHVGRLDDRLTLVNGEKVLPVPMEGCIQQNELVQQCLIFGVGRAFPGLLVVRSDKVPREWTREQYIDAIWPTIEKANINAEKFSQIDREMVEVLDSDADYPRTDKGTIIRAASYKRFADLIESVYVRFEGGAPPSNAAPTAAANGEKMDMNGFQSYLLNLFRDRLGFKNIDLDTDFFNAGIDSLQCIMARGHMMRQLDLGGAVLGQNVVYENPSIKQLASHLVAVASPSSASRAAVVSAEDDPSPIMRDLVEKYGQFDPFVPGDKTPDGDVIVLSGATGSLGAHVLAQLLALPHVRQVYCLVRAPDAAAATARTFSALSDRGLGASLTPRLAAKVVALPADLSRADLGLVQDVLADLRASVTGIIHSAWAVNFNLGVASFAQVHIAGVQNLLRLALSVPFARPARFSFISSISAAAGTPLPARIPERFVADPRHAQEMGYARSKWVAENVVRRAAEEACNAGGVGFRVLRTGQVVGDSKEGRWNATEAIPLMIQAAETMGALPSLAERPSWIPVDVCARAVVELSMAAKPFAEAATAAEDPSHVVYHVQNPRTFAWTEELLPALREAGLEFEVVGQREWVRRLREAAERGDDPVKNPTLKLVDFFAGKYDNDKPGRKGLVFETEKTEGRSEAIAGGFDVVGSGLMRKCVESWRAKEWKTKS